MTILFHVYDGDGTRSSIPYPEVNGVPISPEQVVHRQRMGIYNIYCGCPGEERRRANAWSVSGARDSQYKGKSFLQCAKPERYRCGYVVCLTDYYNFALEQAIHNAAHFRTPSTPSSSPAFSPPSGSPPFPHNQSHSSSTTPSESSSNFSPSESPFTSYLFSSPSGSSSASSSSSGSKKRSLIDLTSFEDEQVLSTPSRPPKRSKVELSTKKEKRKAVGKQKGKTKTNPKSKRNDDVAPTLWWCPKCNSVLVDEGANAHRCDTALVSIDINDP
ncbi:hypothetical protein VKT23_003407 [Stygiomarasmius scandens]|uniref:Uncharacterized protein n=1 Tax=Marasmiellus scandens TaxID=2682957 RepID=A0ABR1JXK6_9AGAR